MLGLEPHRIDCDLDEDCACDDDPPILCRDYHRPPTSECPHCWEIMEQQRLEQ